MQRHRYIEKFQRPFPLPPLLASPPSSPWRRFTSNHSVAPLSPFLPYPAPPPSGQRLMRGMQFPQALARLSSGAPFPYVPTISPAPTCAFVLIRSGWIREEILRGREILSFSRKCAGDPIIFWRDSRPPNGIVVWKSAVHIDYRRSVKKVFEKKQPNCMVERWITGYISFWWHFHCKLRNLIPFVIFPYSYSYGSNTWSRNHCYFSLIRCKTYTKDEKA